MFIIKIISSFQLESLFLSLLLSVFGIFVFYRYTTFFKIIAILCSISTLLIVLVMIEDFFLHQQDIRFSFYIASNYHVLFRVTRLGLVFAALICVLWPIALLYTLHFIKINNFYKPYLFLFFINLSIFLSLGIAFSDNIFTIFILYEILTLCTLPLVLHNVDIKAHRINIINYYKLLQITSILLFLPSMAFFHYSGFPIAENVKFIPYCSEIISSILFLSFVVGIAKSSIFPVFYWLVNAMVASYPVSALLHSLIVVKVGIFCIYRVMHMVFGFDYLYQIFTNNNWIILFPIVGIIYSSIKALRTNVIKTILAYSTINHLNISIMSAFLFTERSFIASVLHMISHSISKIAVFYSIGIVSSFVNNSYNVKNLCSTHKILPFTSFCLLVFCLSLLGMPPFAGFISKYNILFAAIEAHNFFVVIVLFFSSVCSAIYFFNIIQKIYSPLKDSRFILFNVKSYIKKKMYVVNSLSTHNQRDLEWKMFAPMISAIGILVILNIAFYFGSEFIQKFLFV